MNLFAHRIVLLGELHGTNESPRVVGEIACELAGHGTVVVGLEIPRSEQPAIQAFLESGGGVASRSALLASPHWSSQDQDGRASVGMFVLLDRLRELRAAGADIRVVAFDVEPGGSWKDGKPDARDRAMARYLLAQLKTKGFEHAIIYAGNIHTMTRGTVPGEPEYKTLGMAVAQAYADTFALDARYAPGTAWQCRAGEGGQCGVHTIRGQYQGPVPTAAVLQTRDPLGYHGYYYVGPASASSPASKVLRE